MNRVFLARKTLLTATSPRTITCCALVALSAVISVESFSTASLRTFSTTRRTMSSSSDTCTVGAGLTIVRVPCLSDNYGWLIHDPATQSTAVVDTPEAKPYQDEMQKRGWTLTHILNTHQ